MKYFYNFLLIYQFHFIFCLIHFENFKFKIPDISTVGEANKFELFKTRASNIMAGIGFLECKTYHLTNNNNQNIKMNTKISLIE